MEYQIRDIPVYYERYGEGHPIIMIHGFTPDHHLMTGCMEPIFRQREGWQRIYFDLPGMGKTPGKSWITNSDQMLDVVIEFIEHVIPNQSFVLAGESYGGYLARGIIQHKLASVDGLLLICPLIIAEKNQRTLPSHIPLVQESRLRNLLTPSEWEKFESFAVIQTKRTWERTEKEIMVGLEAADEDFLFRLQTDGYPFSFDVDINVEPFEKPALILTGRQDSSVGYRDALKIIENYPRGTFAVLDRAGHNLQIEQETVFNILVNEWLDRVEERESQEK